MSEELPREVALRILSLKEESEEWKTFARRIGLSPQQVSNWNKQGHGASLDAAAKVLAHHKPRLSPAWVLVGLPPRYLPEGAKLEDVVRRELGEKTYRLQVIGKIADGKVSLRSLRDLEDLQRLAPGGAVHDEFAQWLQERQKAEPR